MTGVGSNEIQSWLLSEHVGADHEGGSVLVVILSFNPSSLEFNVDVERTGRTLTMNAITDVGTQVKSCQVWHIWDIVREPVVRRACDQRTDGDVQA